LARGGGASFLRLSCFLSDVRYGTSIQASEQ
jgi:hypothetical protein